MPESWGDSEILQLIILQAENDINNHKTELVNDCYHHVIVIV